MLRTSLGPYRSLFLIEKSNAARKFSIEDRVYVAISQNHSKSAEKNRFETRKSGSLKNVVFFDVLMIISIDVDPES